MKIGFDFHGVLTEPLYQRIMKTMLNDRHEVHILTGSSRKIFEREIEAHTRLKWMWGSFIYDIKFFSISDHLQENYPDKITWPAPDYPYCEDEELWNKVKGEYAQKEDLDIMYDDNPNYLKYFTTPVCLVINERNKHLTNEIGRRIPLKET